MSFESGISEIVLVVEDVARAARFYREVVDLQPSTYGSGPEWAWFWVGDPKNHQRLAVHKGPLLYEEHSPHPEGKRWGQVHFALNVESARLSEAVEHVKACGVEVYGPIDFKWMNARSYYFYDPDGNLVEFWSPGAK